MTREFSVCLLPSEDVARDIETLRDVLPRSPYRDDIPHITLLRGITTPVEMTDGELVQDVAAIWPDAEVLSLTARVTGVDNKSNHMYSTSGLLLLDCSPALLERRQTMMKELVARGYAVERREREGFVPHMTVRLGVPLQDSDKRAADALFVGRTMAFSDWLLFRVIIDRDGGRLMHHVWPQRGGR